MSEQAIQLYVAYEGYVTVEQISDLLSSINQVYESLFFIETPAKDTKRPTSTKLRIERAETGNSIAFHLLQGAEQVMKSADPELRGVAGGVAVLSLTGRVLINNFKRGSLAWYEHRSQELAIRQQSAIVELKERTKDVIAASLAEVSLVGRAVDIDKLAETIGPALVLADKVLSQKNIIGVAIDNEMLKDSGDNNATES